ARKKGYFLSVLMNLCSSFSSNRVRLPILTGLSSPSLIRRYNVGPGASGDISGEEDKPEEKVITDISPGPWETRGFLLPFAGYVAGLTKGDFETKSVTACYYWRAREGSNL
ncbi:MAG: hypothetical protein PHT96_13120, partial [Syntrophorhabdaceae bacterium]|nr:hypothetical protein [Syntrophorhabdaceae bacterium]